MFLRESNMSQSRQEFMKTAAVVTAGVSSLSAESLKEKKLKVGVVGLGGRGTGAVMNSLKADPNTELWAAGELFEDKMNKAMASIGKKFADRVSVPKERQFIGFDAYKKVIDSGVDVVILTTSPAFRPHQLKYAIDAGVHTFAEKPLAVDMTGMKSVMETARKAKAAGISIMTGLVWRYTPSLQKMHSVIQAGEIGEVTYATSSYSGGGRPNKIPPAKYKDPRMSDMAWAMKYWQNFVEFSGDGIMEFMIHGIDKLCWGTGDKKPVRCYANGGNASPLEGSNNWDNFSLFFEYEDGSRSNFLGRQIPGTSPPREDYIQGSKGYAALNSGIKIVKGDKEIMSEKIGGLGYDAEHKLLMEHIRGGKTYNDIIEKMEVSHIMALMGRAAAYTGKIITWDEMMKSEENLFDMENISFESSFAARHVAQPGKTKFV